MTRQPTRREFLSSTSAAIPAAATLAATAPALAQTPGRRSAKPSPGRQQDVADRQARLVEILREPVLKKELFSSPVVIDSLELLRWENSYLCRVRSTDGAEGISVAHSTISRLYPIFLHNLRPFFLGKDARDLDLILERVYTYGFNFRYNGITLGLPLATIEFAVLDLLGRLAGRPLGRLIGEIHSPEVAVYSRHRVARAPARGNPRPDQESGGGT